ncbi:substrate-binding and VWA domain-containing protein [Streptomyces cavernae]|uniref:substrate-binding and VWA domain-containing protein n=1 Tax=Streptomyces cavernae TaxID=2259034 RepID=UPI000FEB8C1C|nr:substrate-binding and VWA domain-containing protein [Streptomyces cavernae]
MGRHSLPNARRAGVTDPRPRTRGRSVVLATVLVLCAASGTAVAVRAGLLSFGESCRDEAVRLNVAASPDLAPALKAVARKAKEDEAISDGHCFDVRVTARESAKMAEAFQAGKGKGTDGFQVWVPDSSVWVDRVSRQGNGDPVTSTGNVASSPVGVAMVPSAAQSLGWPQKTYTWAELAAATMRSDQLKLGTADPSRSATGLLALTQLTASTAGSGNSGGDTQAAAMLKALSQRTSDTDSQVLDTLPRDVSGTEQGNPKRNQALILSEQSAFVHNSAENSGSGLDFFYPEDGSPRLDYPFTLVNSSSPTTDQSRAALRFLTLLGERYGREILEDHGFRTDNDDVPTALVTRAGGSSPQPYSQSAPRPASVKAVEETLGVWTITVQSARLLTVVDVSSSMSDPVPGGRQSRMDVTKASLLQALATFTPEDEIGLWEFSTELDGDRDYEELVPTRRLGDQVGSGTQRDALSVAFTGLKPIPGGATGLYDTTLAAYKAASSTYAQGKFNAVVVLTDGANQDPGSISRSNLITELQKITDPERPVPLIAVAVGPDADRNEVEQIAKATGGSGHQVSDPSQIHSVILKAIVNAGSLG